MYEITISVRDLVEFTLRKGDINFKYIGRQRGRQGTKAHQKVQKSYTENYVAEVTISDILDFEGFKITLQGRIDGILEEQDHITIDEIKSTRVPLEEIEEDFNEMHWAQGMVYAFLYCKQNGIECVNVQLTYYNLDSKQIKRMVRSYTAIELKEYIFEKLLRNYIKWAIMINQWKELRDTSIQKLKFPHAGYRLGQRKLIISIYKTIQEGKKIFFNAPTGIGKTISTIYPSITSMEKGYVEKIFYLTSKNTQKEVVESTIQNLIENELQLKFLSLVAKDKVCFKEKTNCNPEYCEVAKGHFDRINDAVEDIFCNENLFTQDLVAQYAKKHQVCPFEFSLDLSLWSDLVVCDYNYIFDPRVSLKRFTEEKGKYVFLIDEAHNLVDRSRDMYSAELSKRLVLNLRKSIGKEHQLYKNLGKINSEFLKIKKNEEFLELEKPEDMLFTLMNFMDKADKWLAKNNTNVNHYDDILQFYFEVNNFIRIGEYFGDHYRVLVTHLDNELKLKLLCLDSSTYIRESVELGVSSVFFSATLLPLPYYMELLGGKMNVDYHMILQSPFPEDNLCIMLCNKISTTYKNRENSYDQIVKMIHHTYHGKNGNYMIFFPSYEYMDKVYEQFTQLYPNMNTIMQSRMMNDNQRLEFLNTFSTGNHTLAFAVLGGIFSESIDLQGDRLIGTIIVSVGLPKIGVERDHLKEYYNELNGKGFEYAYMYPGFNKVMQGVGRVIRSEADRGAVLLIDSRFSYSNYRKLFPPNWEKAILIDSTEKLDSELESFWKFK